MLGLGLLLGFTLLAIAVGVDWSPLARLDQFVADHAFASTSGHDLRTHAWSTLTNGGQPLVLRGLMCLGAALLALRHRRLLAAWLVMLAGIAASRIYLGVHYLSDVVGGVLLGSGLALVTFWTASLVHSRRPGPTL